MWLKHWQHDRDRRQSANYAKLEAIHMPIHLKNIGHRAQHL
jgi:hypothetical protein